MKYLKLFEGHITEAEVAKICRKYGIKNWSLNSDGLVDISKTINLDSMTLTSLPLKFGRVEGNFYCYDNHLTSLEGCPDYVGDDFDCDSNQLTSLEGCPQYVGGDFHCDHNNIRSFQGIDKIQISGDFYCNDNPIYSLWDLFEDVTKIEMFNEWGIIQVYNVILYRLNDFLEEIGKREITYEKLKRIKKYYNII